MTLKQRLFLDNYIKLGNSTEAALAVYKTRKRNVASQIGYENLRKPEIKEAIEAYFKRINPNPLDITEAFADVLKNGTARQKLEASIIFFKVMGLYPE